MKKYYLIYTFLTLIFIGISFKIKDDYFYIPYPNAIEFLLAFILTRPFGAALGKHAYKMPVSSTKSMHGHPLGAGGGIEAVACIKAMEDNWLPPTIGLHEADPECDLDYVPNVGREKKLEYTVSNSFAFGGLNAVLVFGCAPA